MDPPPPYNNSTFWRAAPGDPVVPPPPRARHDEASAAYTRWLEEALFRATTPIGNVTEGLHSSISTFRFLQDAAAGGNGRTELFYTATPRSALGSSVARVPVIPTHPTFEALVDALFRTHFESLHTTLDGTGAKLHALVKAGVLSGPDEVISSLSIPTAFDVDTRTRVMEAVDNALRDKRHWARFYISAVVGDTSERDVVTDLDGRVSTGPVGGGEGSLQ